MEGRAREMNESDIGGEKVRESEEDEERERAKQMEE